MRWGHAHPRRDPSWAECLDARACEKDIRVMYCALARPTITHTISTCSFMPQAANSIPPLRISSRRCASFYSAAGL